MCSVCWLFAHMTRQNYRCLPSGILIAGDLMSSNEKVHPRMGVMHAKVEARGRQNNKYQQIIFFLYPVMARVASSLIHNQQSVLYPHVMASVCRIKGLMQTSSRVPSSPIFICPTTPVYHVLQRCHLQ